MEYSLSRYTYYIAQLECPNYSISADVGAEEAAEQPSAPSKLMMKLDSFLSLMFPIQFGSLPLMFLLP